MDAKGIGVGFRVEGLGFREEGLGCGVEGLSGFGYRVFRVGHVGFHTCSRHGRSPMM